MEFFPVYVCVACACVLRSLGFKRPPSSSSTFLRRVLFEKWFRIRSRRTFNATRTDGRRPLGRSFFPSKAVPSASVASVLCKRRSSGSGATASGRAGRPPIRQRKSSWKNPWETGERERKERASEGVSAIVHTWPKLRGGEGGRRERMAALIVIRVWRAKRTNFMSQRHIHRSIRSAPLL